MRTNELRVLMLADDATAALASESILTSLPTTAIVRLSVAELAARRIPTAAAAIVGAAFDAGRGVEALRSLRGSGFEGEAILVVSPVTPEIEARVAEVGARCVATADLPRRIPELLAASTRPPELSVAWQELRRVQRLVAMGEVARSFQHEVNNPLTALLAEAQMLAMEPLDEGTHAAVERIVELCKRVVGTVRRLDAVRPASGGEPPRA